MEKAQFQLASELKDRKEIEADLRTNRDSIERQLNEKSKELEKLLAATAGAENKDRTSDLAKPDTEELMTKISKKDEEIRSFQKKIEEEKSTKDQLQKQLNKIEASLKAQDETLKPLQEANQNLENELKELRITQKEFDKTVFQLEDTQQELESLEIANEQLMTEMSPLSSSLL